MGSFQDNRLLFAQVEDALREVKECLWLARSHEERLYLAEMEMRLDQLAAIVDKVLIDWKVRTRERCEPPLACGHPKWNETIGALVGAFQGARSLNGVQFSNGLSHLIDHLRGQTPQSNTNDERSIEPNPKRTNKGDEPKEAPRASRIGPNINALRKECGWSFAELSKASGIDRKLILSHVNKGAKPTPRIMKEYAETFTKRLGRRVTAPDLEK